MRKNYNYISNLQEPDSERIRQYQDFAALLAEHEQQSVDTGTRPGRVRSLRIAFAAAATVAAGLALLWMLRTGATDAVPTPQLLAEESAAFFAERPAIQPALPNLSVPQMAQTVASATGGEIDLGERAHLRIPATAFIDAEGNAVTGEVQITYRTMTDQADLLISGLPMEYRKTEQRYQLAAAGVVEVAAFQNGEEVQLAPDKTLEVTLVESIRLVSNTPVASREVLYWGNDRANWLDGQAASYTMDTRAEDLGSKEARDDRQQEYRNEKAALQTELEAAKQVVLQETGVPTAPVAPEGGSSERPSFDLDLANESVIQLQGELAANPGRVAGQRTWVVSEKSADFDPRALTVVWETIEVEALNDREYRMTFRAGTASDQVIVKPLLSPAAYATAMEAYRTELAEWEAEKARVEAQREDRLSKLTARYAAREAELDAEYRQALAGAKDSTAGEPVLTELVHTFRIPRLGIWSCVEPFVTDHEVVIAGLRQKNGDEIKNKVAYLIDRTENTVYRFHAGEQGALLRFREKPDSDFVVCVALGEERMAMVSTLNLENNSSILTLSNEQPPLGSVEEVKRWLAI